MSSPRSGSWTSRSAARTVVSVGVAMGLLGSRAHGFARSIRPRVGDRYFRSDAQLRASGFGIGSPTLVRVLRSVWWKGSALPRISRTVSSLYDHVPSRLIETRIRTDSVRRGPSRRKELEGRGILRSSTKRHRDLPAGDRERLDHGSGG